MSRTLLAVCLSFACATTSAATFTVTRLDDVAPDGCATNGCTLREAVLAANAANGTDTIVLGRGSHVLRQPSLSAPVTLVVDDHVAFSGAGRDLTNVQSQGRGSLFVLRDSTVSFTGIALRNAQSTGTDFGGLGGGAIRADNSTLSLANARLSGSSATDGGALHLTDTTLDVSGTLIESHKAGHDGGGIWAQNSPIRLRAGTVLRWNTAGSRGGGIGTDTEVVADDDCTVSGNFANIGGGIGSIGALLTVRGVATAGGDGLFEISGNSVSGIEPFWNIPNGRGGGIQSSYGALIERVALLDNDSDHASAGFDSDRGPLTMRDSYVANNTAELTAAGGRALSGTDPVLIERVGFDGNQARYNAALVMHDTILDGSPLVTATLRNVDFHANVSTEGSGTLNTGMALTLTNATFWNNTESGNRAAIQLTGTGTATYRNSVMLGRCVGDPARFLALGTNLRSFESANSCAGGFSMNPHHLSRGAFGGLFDISGTTNAASATIDIGTAAYCSTVDIRNRTRGLPCDIGVFEYGAQ